MENFDGIRNFYDVEDSVFPNIVSTPSGIFSVGKDVAPALMDAYEFLSGNVLEEYVGDTGDKLVNAAQEWFGPDTQLVSGTSGFLGLMQFRTKFPIKYAIKLIDYRYLCVSYGLGDTNSFQWIVFQDHSAYETLGKIANPAYACNSIHSKLIRYGYWFGYCNH